MSSSLSVSWTCCWSALSSTEVHAPGSSTLARNLSSSSPCAGRKSFRPLTSYPICGRSSYHSIGMFPTVLGFYEDERQHGGKQDESTGTDTGPGRCKPSRMLKIVGDETRSTRALTSSVLLSLP